MATLRGVAGRAALLAFSLVVSLALSEAVLALLLSSPPSVLRALPGGTLSHLQAYYKHHERTLIQALPECAQYDPGLFYTLRPGECRFRGREFDTRVAVNSLGVRDDESSLQAPEVVVTGDSFAMGWGVQQDESFSALLERALGRTVLNVGIPSYGTVRERRILDRIDASRLRCLIVQYDDNDPPENATFEHNGDTLVISHERTYRQDVLRGTRRSGYWFPKITVEIVRGVLGQPDPLAADPGPVANQARLFVKAMLKAGRLDLEDVQVIVFPLNADRVVNGEFVKALEHEVSKAAYPPWVQRMKILDLSGVLAQDDFYILDDHLRAAGHRKVADALLPLARDALAARP